MHLPTAPSQVSSYVIINIFKLQAWTNITDFAQESCFMLGVSAPTKSYSGRLPNQIF